MPPTWLPCSPGTSWSHRFPRSLPARCARPWSTVPVNALLGSAVLLLGAVPVVVLGDHGEGAAVLIAALTMSVALIWYRHRRAAAALLAALPLVNGWTDLGRRTLPDGSRIDRLLVGDGQAIACSTITTSTALEEDCPRRRPDERPRPRPRSAWRAAASNPSSSPTRKTQALKGIWSTTERSRHR